MTPTNVKPNAAAEALLHPVRLRIVLAAVGREITATELSRDLPDVPVATLYRHLAKLADAGLLEVVRECRVRGAVERTYRVDGAEAHLEGPDAAHLSPNEHLYAFTTFVGALLDTYGRYLQQPDANPAVDGVSFRQARLYLTDAELHTLVTSLQATIAPYLESGPGPGRTPRLLNTILLPDPAKQD